VEQRHGGFFISSLCKDLIKRGNKPLLIANG
jgi:hypothetical protein